MASSLLFKRRLRIVSLSGRLKRVRSRRSDVAGMKLGPFEQAVLVATLMEGSNAYSLPLRTRLESDSGKAVSRGAFYATVERLARKGLLEWTKKRPPDSERARKQRLFSVTAEGLEALREARDSLEERWARLAEALGDA
jgi:PadR family transcriptional regulator PadR